MTTAIQWQRLELPYRRGDAAITVFHWADTQLASAWFRYARQLANDHVQIAALDVPIAQASDANGRRQVTFMWLIVNALANAYNALNIPWYNHPTARSLWREWWSGPPHREGGPESTAATTEFELRPDWNDAWYKGQKPDWMFPVGANLSPDLDAHTLGVTQLRGRLGQTTEALFRRNYRPTVTGANYAADHPVELIARCGLTLGVRPGVPRHANTQIVYERDVINVPFAFLPTLATPGGNGLPPIDCPPPTDIFECGTGRASQHCAYDNRPCDRAGASNPAFVARDWRSFTFDGAFELFGVEVDPKVKIAAGVPLRDHLPWLQAWTNAAAAESPESIILASREWVWNVNAKWQQDLGGEDAFFSRIVRNPSAILAQMHREDPTAQAVAGGIGAVGGIFAGLTFGISALVGGAVSTVIRLVDAGTIKSVEGAGRDDLGRYKPVYERGWLTGDPSHADAVPAHSVDAPDGFHRNLLIPFVPAVLENANVAGVNRPVVRPLDAWIRDAISTPVTESAPPEAQQPHPLIPFPFEPEPIPDTSTPPAPGPEPTPPTAGMSTGTKVALAVGGIAAVGAIVYVATRRAPRSR